MRSQLFTIVLCFFPRLVCAQQPDSAPGFALTEVMIPMRDGGRLHTRIFAPRSGPGPLQISFPRPPYGSAHAGTALSGYSRAFANDGYIFAPRSAPGPLPIIFTRT